MMPTTQTIVTTGAVTVTDGTAITGSGSPIVVGDPPQWADDSDATYAELETYENPTAGFTDHGTATLVNQTIPNNAAAVSVLARIRYQNLSTDMAAPHAAVLTADGLLLQNLETIDFPGSLDITWVDVPLPPTVSMQAFITAMNTGVELFLRVSAPRLGTHDRFVGTRVFEAFLVVTGPSGAQPPCRLYPADTLGSVGGSVRQYPPSKSRQRSSRGVGYY